MPAISSDAYTTPAPRDGLTELQIELGQVEWLGNRLRTRRSEPLVPRRPPLRPDDRHAH